MALFKQKIPPLPKPVLVAAPDPGIKTVLGGKGIQLGPNVWWDWQHLPNAHVAMIGASGSGKTQTVKALVHELKGQVQVIVIDFHGDQAVEGETCYPIHMQSQWGINPLIINPDPEGGGPSLQAIQVATSLRRSHRMGPNQEGYLLNLLTEIYTAQGILQSNQSTWGRPPPTFADLETSLTELAADSIDKSGNREAKSLCTKLAATFQYQVFSRPQPHFAQDSLIRIDVSKLPPELQALTAESLAHQLMNQHRLVGESPPRTFLVIDEAKELKQGTALERIYADGRKYGLSVIVASQSETHFNRAIMQNSATKIVLPVDASEVDLVARKFKFDKRRVAQLKPLTALCRLGPEVCEAQITPYYQRCTAI